MIEAWCADKTCYEVLNTIAIIISIWKAIKIIIDCRNKRRISKETQQTRNICRSEIRGVCCDIDGAKGKKVHGRLTKKSEVEGEYVDFIFFIFVIFVAEVQLNENWYFDKNLQCNQELILSQSIKRFRNPCRMQLCRNRVLRTILYFYF